MAGVGAGSGKRRRGLKMPVHSRGDKKETNHHDEMEVDYAENEGSSSEDEDTESSSVSEDGDSSGARPREPPGPRVPRRAAGRAPHTGQPRPAGRAGRGREGRGRRLAASPGLPPRAPGRPALPARRCPPASGPRGLRRSGPVPRPEGAAPTPPAGAPRLRPVWETLSSLSPLQVPLLCVGGSRRPRT